MDRTCSAFPILTSKTASCHNGLHFFDISTSKNGPNSWCLEHFDWEMCFTLQRRALFRHLNFQTLRESCAFSVLTSKCALDHNCVRSSDISTSKSGPNIPIWCLSQFVFEMCFAPQWRALLRRLNRQKWLLFWLRNVLCGITTCTFSTSQVPKVECVVLLAF